MRNILTLNQRIFGNNCYERRMSKKALKALASDLYVPVDSEEITYDEGSEIDGGWFLGVQFSASTCSAMFNTVIGMCDKSIGKYGYLGPLFQAITTTFAAAYDAVYMWVMQASASVLSFLYSHPVVAVAVGLVAASAATIVAGCLVCGAQNKGFKIGWEVGWLKFDWQFEAW